MSQNLKVIKNKNLKAILKKKILELKSSHWNFSFAKQKNWLKKNILDEDLHIILIIDETVVGYVMLRKRYFYHSSNERKKQKHLYFDTLIIKKSFRGLNLSKILVKKTISLSKKLKSPMFLLCNKKTTLFYKKLKWKLLNKKHAKIVDHKSKNEIMYYDNQFKVKNLKNKKKINIYINF